MKKANFYIFLLLIAFTSNLDAQLVKELIRDVIITPNKDTVIIDRTPGDWWFGPFASITPFSNFYFGKLVLPRFKEIELQELYQNIEYLGGNGFGLNLGLYGEWKKVENDWGAALRLSLIDFRTSRSQTELKDTVRTIYENKVDFSYLSFSPSATYEIKNIPGLFAFGGLDFEIPLNALVNQNKRFYYSEQIDNIYSMNLDNLNFRVGMHLGASYDLFSASITALARTQLSLYVLINSGTNQISNFGSNFNSFSIKAGIAIKIGPDNKTVDTLYYNPDRVEPLLALASVTGGPGVNFTLTPQSFVAADLAYIEIPQISTVVPEVTEVKPVEVTQVVPPPRPTRNIVYDKREVFNFPKSETDYELSKELREYLDALAQFMIANPNSRVIIEGHNDDRGGSVQENYRRSVIRAEQVKNYLMRKGIPERRITNTGYGATRTLVPNTTAANRAKNRRVEIIVQR